jgi:hypothetical protein
MLQPGSAQLLQHRRDPTRLIYISRHRPESARPAGTCSEAAPISDLAGRPRTPGHDGHGTEVFGALRLPGGNTLIACGNGNRVIEVNPEGKTVWALEHDELPGIRLFWVTTLKVLPDGHIVVGNCHAGPDNPQLIEVTRDKKVVWTFKDFTTFGNDLAAATVLD